MLAVYEWGVVPFDLVHLYAHNPAREELPMGKVGYLAPDDVLARSI